MVIMALGVVVFYNYLFHLSNQAKEPDQRLPFISRLDKNLGAVSDTGEKVELKDLKGKVFLMSYLFTRCPSGCAGIQQEIADIREEFGKPEDLHFVSVSLDPEHDQPEVLKAFREKFEFVGDNWWFLTGDPKTLRGYMTMKVGFHPPTQKKEDEMLFEGDLFSHDMRIALVDHLGHVRGMYEVMHEELAVLHREKLRKDLKTLLEEQEEYVPYEERK